jgi:hypothetical protein
MKNKEKLLRLLIVVFILMNAFAVHAQLPKIGQLKLIKKTDFISVKKQQHPVALRAIRQGKKPAGFKGVRMELSPKLISLSKQEKVEISKNIKGAGILPVKSLRKAKISPGNIYFDPESRLVFSPVKAGKDTLLLKQPPINKVFKTFKIPKQKVAFNIANTSYTLQGTDVKDETTSTGDYLLKMEFNDTIYHINKEIKKGHSKTKITIDLNLDGHLYIKNPVVEAKYTANDGYRFSVLMQEEAEIKAELKTKITSEVSVPLWAFDIPAGDYGSCRVGIFAFIDMNGEIKLEYKISQSLEIKAGMHGKTFAYYPKSYKKDYSIKKKFDQSYKIYGELKVYGGVEVTGDITVLKYDLVKIVMRGGPQLEIKTTDNARNYEAKLDMRFLITAKLKKIDKKFTLLDKSYLIWEKKKTNYGGYVLQINDADAYNDRVWGVVFKEQDSTPYNGKLVLKVTHKNNSQSTYQTQTDEKGVFAVENVPLVKGDKVQIKLKNNPNWSKPVLPTIPFKEIRLHYADYYTNQVEGTLTSKIDMFPKKKQSASPVQHANIPAGVTTHTGIPDKNLFKLPITINENIFKNAITYNGDVEVITTPDARHSQLKLLPVQIGKKHKKGKAWKVDKRIPAFKLKKKVYNLPFGVFLVKNVDIKPYDRVKVSVNIDGFILESNSIMSDGLIFTPSVDIDKKGSIKSPVIQAADSYILVNAIRSDKIPAGKVKVIKGIDMKHTQAVNKNNPVATYNYPKIKEFKQAVHPLIYYNKTLNLQASAKHPGFAEAHTGPWKVTNVYYDRTKVLRLEKFDGHRFEYIGYQFDGKWVGYRYYQQKCLMDNDVLQKLKKPGKTFNHGNYQAPFR